MSLKCYKSVLRLLGKHHFSTTFHNNNNHKKIINDSISFPCLDRAQLRNSQQLMGEGPEPIYSRVQSGFEIYKSQNPLFLDYGDYLTQFDIAYETWGKLNESKSNAILLHTGLSASSHAKSQLSNSKPGWWENFIGPNKPLDTSKYFIICTNVLGGCYGSTGPMSITPFDDKRYATRFPVLSVNDMIRAQHDLISQHFKIPKLYASVGSSLGGMQSLAYVSEFPDQVEKIISVSACSRSHPHSIGMRFAQRQIVMHDPNWQRGSYYDTSLNPHMGMKLARSVATITYRSGPEWESRFARVRLNESYQPALCPDFLVETYLDHQGDKFSIEFDPNSFLYISKAMDLFDLGWKNQKRVKKGRLQSKKSFNDENFETEFKSIRSNSKSMPDKNQYKITKLNLQETPEESIEDLRKGIEHFSDKEILIIGVKSDILFPSWQQKETFDLLCKSQKLKNKSYDNLRHVELSEKISQYGHDTFLLDVENVGIPIKNFLG